MQQSYNNHWNGMITESVILTPKRPVIMAGPCMFENRDLGFRVAEFLKNKCESLGFSYIFKSSYDKANRTSKSSARGPGVRQGLQWLSEIKKEFNIPILTDIHSIDQAKEVAKVVDIIQIPAFLFSQKELLEAAASTGKIIQIKKGQWATSEEILDSARFLNKLGFYKILLVERGSCFGYNNLVVDFRNLVDMRKEGHAIVFDATHAIQLPGAGNGSTLGLRSMVPPLARAAVALGIDALFMEVHEDPDKALSDAESQLSLEMAGKILDDIACLLSGFK